MKHKGRQQKKKRDTKKQQDRKTINNMAIVSPLLAVITLNVNRLKDTNGWNELKTTRFNYMLFIRDSFYI